MGTGVPFNNSLTSANLFLIKKKGESEGERERTEKERKVEREREKTHPRENTQP